MLKRQQFVGSEVIYVGHIFHQTALEQLHCHFLAYSVYVHHVSAHKVLYAACDLWWAVLLVRTHPCSLTLHSLQWRATCRTCGHKFYRLAAGYASAFIHAHYLGYDFSAFFHIHHVAVMNVERLDYVGVVQRRALHHRARKQHRVKIGNRGYDTASPHLKRHISQFRAFSLRRKFICYGIARRFCRCAKIEPLAQ